MTTTVKAGAVSAEALIETLEWRYACKKFDSIRKLDAATWSALEQALLLSPSSFGLQPWKFVVVTNQALRDQLVEVSWNQRQPADCSHLVVICRNEELTAEYIDHYLDTIASARKVPVDSLAGYGKMMKDFASGNLDKETWMIKQCYIALGNLLDAAALLGVDACPMEGFDSAAYDRILGLAKHGCRSVVVCPLGYRAADDNYAKLAKVRFPASELVVNID